MTVAIGAYVLCDGTLENGVAVSDLRINQTRSTDVFAPLAPVDGGDPLLRDATSELAYDRTGRPCQYVFTVKRTHADLQAAEQFILELEGNLPSNGDITFTTTGPSETSFLLPNGKLQTHELNQQVGATTFHTYTMIGGVPPAVS